MKESDEGFDQIDTNHNGTVGPQELETALKQFAKSREYNPTKADWAWVADAAEKDAATNGHPNSMDKKEFNKFANQFAKHFKLMGC